MTWTNGRHAYYGRNNSKAKRMVAKMMKGIDMRQVGEAYALLTRENLKKNNERARYPNIIREEEHSEGSV